MYHKGRKRRSEAQRRHDTLLHQSRYDPVAYQAASLKDLSGTVKKQRGRARAAEADAEHSRKALLGVQNQVSPLAGTNILEFRDLPGRSAPSSFGVCSSFHTGYTSVCRAFLVLFLYDTTVLYVISVDLTPTFLPWVSCRRGWDTAH
jgi:hypothetical protein